MEVVHVIRAVKKSSAAIVFIMHLLFDQVNDINPDYDPAKRRSTYFAEEIC